MRRLTGLLTAGLLLAGLLTLIGGHTAGIDGGQPPWTAPPAMALQRISPVDTAQHEPNLFNNLDCSLTEYRLTTGSDMRTGCFTPTAFGLLDSDSDTVIFNGTDEALPLLPYSPHEVLAPWPNAVNLLALDAASTGGSYLNMYKYPLAVMRDQRDAWLRLAGKQLTAPPDLSLKDAAGQPLIVNPQTIAFSDNGSWLVAESLSGSFIRINLATLDMMDFAPSYVSWGGSGLLKSQVAITDDGRYAAIANDTGEALKVYDLGNCAAARCQAYDYFPFARQRIGGLTGVRHLRFINEGLLSFEAKTADPAAGGVYELAPRDHIGALIDYLALGDSYTSGEGAFDYLAGTDSADNMCHLSVNSYPLLLTRALFGNGGHSVACSGAVIDDLGDMGADYRGQVRDGATFDQLQQGQGALLNSVMANYLPGYVTQQRFVKRYQPAIMTVSAGGNDIGFGDIVQRCVEPRVSLSPGGNDCYNTYEDRLELTDLIDRTVPRWTRLFKQLATAAPGGRLYVIGYPQIALAGGRCGLNVHLSQSELEFAAQLIDYLNEQMARAAAKTNAGYVDISHALTGHRLCEAAGYDVAVNGLTAGRDAGFLGLRLLGKESYHPNALGQALMEQAILRQTNNFASRTSATAAGDRQKLLAKPKTGRKTNRLTPVKHLTKKVLQRGKTATVKAKGSRHGLKPRTAYSVRLGGGSGPVIGTVISDDNGDLAADITVPGSAGAGGQTIDLTGENQAGETIDLTQPVFIPVSDTDSDGDGAPDNTDSCPGAVNSGQDSDHDGIDDTCDSLISPPLTVGQGAAGGQSDGDGGGYADTGSQLQATAAPVSSRPPGGPAATIVTSLLPGHSTPAGRLRPSSVKSAAAAGSTLRLPARPFAAAAVSPLKMPDLPRVINWLPWILLPVLLWLLLLLALCLDGLINRCTKTESFRLQ